jgi:hypothetical protein
MRSDRPIQTAIDALTHANVFGALEALAGHYAAIAAVRSACGLSGARARRRAAILRQACRDIRNVPPGRGEEGDDT